jgi:hypothetical protein
MWDPGRSRRVRALAILTCVLAACVAHPIGPARTYGSYAAKASTTVESAISAVETVRLLADTAADGRAMGAYTSVAVSEQEDTLGGLRGTFASIQPPPDERSTQLRRQLTALLNRSFDHVGDVRIETRRGHLDRLDVVAAPLAADADALNALLDTLP